MSQRSFEVENHGRVSALLELPDGSGALYVLAHGAGAGMRHAFLEHVAHALAARRIGTFRYQFPYMERGRRRPDPPHIAEATVRAAVDAAAEAAPDVPLVAGGKSFGGRMTSAAQAGVPLPGVRGLAFLGFPLHAAGRPGDRRAAHLAEVEIPMLFLQGTRDRLADLTLMRSVCSGLGERATLRVVEGGDHSFKVLERSNRTEADVMEELAEAIAGWIERTVRSERSKANGET